MESNEIKFICYKCPGRICGGCYAKCTCGFSEQFTPQKRFDDCPHKIEALYIQPNETITTQSSCYSCGYNFKESK